AVKSEIGFFNYAVAWALDLKAENRMGYFKKAHSTISNFASFVFKRDLKLIDFINGGEKSDLPFENISVKTLNDFEHWLKAKELKTNTVYGNLKTLRTIYYKAENEEIFETRKNPFRRKKLVQAKTTKKALSLEEIKLLENCQLSDDQLELARDMFLFSFYCSGLRWGDVCTLRWANIEGDVIKVIPRKTIRTTNAVMKIALHPKANSIIKKYRGDRGLRDWIFPLIEGEPEPNKIIGILGSKNAITNKLLKYVASTARVKKPISFHMARHSYATLAIQKNAPLQVISQLLGHSDLKTTQVYLKELDNDVTNAAHLNILDY
ncbi:MAG: tyrosine-type recombinase/integrase, partial [Bacteroidia bacterium]